jgi:hypothetical protein
LIKKRGIAVPMGLYPLAEIRLVSYSFSPKGEGRVPLLPKMMGWYKINL